MRQLDLQDLSSVRRFAEGIDTVDVLINNAGIMADPSRGHRRRLREPDRHQPPRPLRADQPAVAQADRPGGDGVFADAPLRLHQSQRPELAIPALFGLAGLQPVEAGQPVVHQELQRRLDGVPTSVRALAAHPGWSHTNLQGNSGRKLGDAAVLAVDRIVSTDADFGARQTLYAASQDLPGDTFVGPRFGLYGRTQPTWRNWPAKRAGTAAALWELSERITGTKFPL